MKAFPVTDQHNSNINEGMDLRDYFAAKAMQAYLNAVVISFMDDKCKKEGADSEIVSKVAYQIADAMLKERKS